MPNRIIKESIRTSKGVNALSDFQFRLWVYLITYVDDYGRGSADPELLKGFVFPRRKGVTEKSIADALDSLANMGMIHLYNVDGESFFCFPNWGKHQRIQTKKSRFPEPTEENGNPRYSTVTHRDSPPESESESEFESNTNTNTNPKRARAGFAVPSQEEASAYFREKGSTDAEAQKFCDFYASKGWKVGKEPMKDWQASARGWISRNKSGMYGSFKPVQQENMQRYTPQERKATYSAAVVDFDKE
ncbi:MAG: hypothetical protein IJ418_12025 [Clostridia bacterium]|nr:hypothetical protein [Clostridia bacterium]